jgi:hypothetical protein
MKEFPPFHLDTVNQCLWRGWDRTEQERVCPPAVYGRAPRATPDAPRAPRCSVAQHERPGGGPEKPHLRGPNRPRGRLQEAAVHRDPTPARVPFHRPGHRGGRAGSAAGHRHGQAGRPRAPPRGVARSPPARGEGRAADRLRHRGARHRQDRARRRVPATGRARYPGPSHRARTMHRSVRKQGSVLPDARFLELTRATAERTWQALAWDTNARVASAQLDFNRAQNCIDQALSTMEGFEVPLAAWRVHGTAAELSARLGNNAAAEQHRASSRATILRLADSLPHDEPLRVTFLSAPPVRQIVGQRRESRAPSIRPGRP